MHKKKEGVNGGEVEEFFCEMRDGVRRVACGMGNCVDAESGGLCGMRDGLWMGLVMSDPNNLHPWI